MVIVTIFSVTSGPTDPTIGFKINGSIVDVYNNKATYIFNKSNGIQWTEDRNNYWTENVLCIGHYSGETWVKDYCVNELGEFNRNINSDNSTYVNATLWKDFTYSGYDLRVVLRYHLKQGDEKLSIIPYIKNLDVDDITTDIGFAWKVQNIKINRDEDDTIFINSTSYSFDDNLNLMFNNMTVKRIKRYSNGTNLTVYNPQSHYQLLDNQRGHITLNWNKNLNYKVKLYSSGTQSSSYVALLINVGTLASGQEKSTIIYWKDPTTGFVDPDGETQAEWDLGEGISNWAAVNDTIRNPNDPTGEGGDIFNQWAGEYDNYTMTTISNVDTVSAVVMWAYYEDLDGANHDLKFNINMNGWQTPQILAIGPFGTGWGSKTFTGSWTQSDLNNLQLSLEYDSGEGMDVTVYSVYAEVNYTADSTAPSVYLKSPSNASSLNSLTQWFVANFTDNSNLKNATVYIWNSTKSLINSTVNVTIVGVANTSNLSVILPYDDTFSWNYYACDAIHNCAFNATNWSLTIVSDSTPPDISIVYPTNNSYHSVQDVNVNYTVSGEQACWYTNDTYLGRRTA